MKSSLQFERDLTAIQLELEKMQRLITAIEAEIRELDGFEKTNQELLAKGKAKEDEKEQIGKLLNTDESRLPILNQGLIDNQNPKQRLKDLVERMHLMQIEITKIENNMKWHQEAIYQAAESSSKEENSKNQQQQAKDFTQINIKSSKEISSTVTSKSAEGAVVGGIRLTLESLAAKLAEVQQKQKEIAGNESENVKGFSAGGSSEETSATVDAELKMLKQLTLSNQQKLLSVQLAQYQKQLTESDLKNVQKALGEQIREARSKGLIQESVVDAQSAEQQNDKQNSLQFSSSQDALKAAQNIAQTYRLLGINAEISKTQKGQKEQIVVKVELPKELANQNPQELQPSRILEAIKNEEAEKGKTKSGEESSSWASKFSSKVSVRSGSWVERVSGDAKGATIDSGRSGNTSNS